MNLLQLVQTVCDELGISSPNAVATSTDQQVIQLYALMNKVGNDIITNDQWQGLDKEYRFNTVVYSYTGNTTSGSSVVSGLGSTTGIVANTFMCTGTGIPSDTYVLSVDSSSQVTLSNNASATGSVTLTFTQTKYALPSDYDHQINRTQWDKTNHWELMGPKSPEEWQYLKGGIVSTGPRIRYRILGGYFQIWPPTTTASQLGFEYISNAWVTSSSGVAKTRFTADDDTCNFRDRTMICGTKFEFFAVKGFDTAQLLRDYEIQKSKEMALDRGAPTLSLSPRSSTRFITSGSVPDSGYGQ